MRSTTHRQQISKLRDHNGHRIEQANVIMDDIKTGTPYRLPPRTTAPALTICPRLLRSFLRSMTGKKSVGPDGIQVILLQKLPRNGFTHLLKIYNCLRFNTFPDKWQIAIITPLLKPGKDPAFPRS